MVKKISRYKNILEKFLAGETGRRFFHIAYSVGAAVVLVGALFKMNHYPMGDTILMVGIVTEVLMFTISAFDRPSREYPWEEVFPELATPEQVAQKQNYEERKRLKENLQQADGTDKEVPAVRVSHTVRPAVAVTSAVAEPQAPVAIASATELPNVVQTSEQYAEQVEQMGENIEKFNELTQSLNRLSEILSNSFAPIINNSENISQTTQGYVEQMTNLNRNIAGLNTIYEIQLKGVSSQIDAIDQINNGLKQMRNLYEGTIPNSASFKSETDKLVQQMQDLNLVYARMLQAMTANMAMNAGLQQGGQVPPQQG